MECVYCSASTTFLAINVVPTILLSANCVDGVGVSSETFCGLFIRDVGGVLVTLTVYSMVFFVISVKLFFLRGDVHERTDRS